MEVQDAVKLLPPLPLWVSIPILVVTLFTTMGPRLIQTVRDLNSRDRAYQRERQQLELLKLRYEIEALKKEKGLEPLPPSVSVASAPAAAVTKEGPPLTQTILLKRFLYGGLGALLPLGLTVLIQDSGSMSVDRTQFFVLGYVFRVMILFVLGGMIGALNTRPHATPIDYIMAGLSISLLLTVIVSSVARHPTQVSSTGTETLIWD